MSIHDIKKEKEARVMKGTGFFIDGFGWVSIEWTQDENFDPSYDKTFVIESMYRAGKRLMQAIDDTKP